MIKPRKPYTLVGVDGNAHAVMGYVRNAMRRSGYGKKEMDAYRDDCMSGSYDELLAKSVDMLDRVNGRLGFTDDDYE